MGAVVPMGAGESMLVAMGAGLVTMGAGEDRFGGRW